MPLQLSALNLLANFLHPLSFHSLLSVLQQKGKHSDFIKSSRANSWASLGGSVGKEPACNVGDLCSVPGLGRSPGEGKGYPLQYSGLENSVDCIVHGVTKSQTQLSDFHVISLHFTSRAKEKKIRKFIFKKRTHSYYNQTIRTAIEKTLMTWKLRPTPHLSGPQLAIRNFK